MLRAASRLEEAFGVTGTGVSVITFRCSRGGATLEDCPCFFI